MCSLCFDIEENTIIEALVRFRFASVAITTYVTAAGSILLHIPKGSIPFASLRYVSALQRYIHICCSWRCLQHMGLSCICEDQLLITLYTHA